MKLLLCCLLAVSALAQPTSHERWKKLFNTNIDSIHQVYTPKAVLVTTDGIVHATAESRALFYKVLKKQIGQIKSVTTLHREEAGPGASFEIGYFISGTDKKLLHLIVSKKVNDEFVREVEILSEADSETLDAASINAARTLWMKYCNSHRANELVSNVYTGNAVYYNNNRTLVGTAAIAAEYRYMNNPSYQLTLTPIAVEAAGNGTAFEIGQCSGSYRGKYILVWKKTGNTWKVAFDSN